jgi:thioredoxin-like negative regulator of GroEL
VVPVPVQPSRPVPVPVPVPIPVRPLTPRHPRGTVLLFTQPGCPPCQQVRRSLEHPDVRAARLGLDLREIDVRRDPGRARQYRVAAVPTLVRLDATGREVSRKQGGLDPARLRDWLLLARDQAEKEVAP